MVKPPVASRITERELEVIRWVARGATNEGIATGMNLSRHTVTSHLQHITYKTGVYSRAGIVGHAYRSGWLDSFPPETRGYIALTSRCADVLVFMSYGDTDETIARKMDRSEGTTKHHVKRLLRAMHAKNRWHAVALGFQLGLIKE